MLFSCWQKDTTTRPYRPYRAVLLFSNTKRRVILRMRSDTFQSACDAASTKNKRMATQTNAVKSLSDEVDFSLSGSKCTVSARFLHGFKTCKGCKSLQNRTKGAETPNSKLAMYRREITVKHNFQKLRESPGVRYESVGRGFQRVGMSTVEAVNRKISWLFCFSGRVCTLLHISCTLYKKAMNSLHRLHSVYFAAQKLSLSGRGPSILLTQDRFVA